MLSLLSKNCVHVICSLKLNNFRRHQERLTMFALQVHLQKNVSLSVKASEALKEHLTVCHPGFTIALDNIDFAM